MPLQYRMKPKEDYFAYYKDDIRLILSEKDSEKVESSIEFHHINVGIYASKFFYPHDNEAKMSM